MNKANSTKKALVVSIVALCLCFTMLVGTTFAWFTDSVASKGNIIQSGTLDVEMYWANADVAVSDVATWTDASTGAMFESTLWEPGYVEAKHIKIQNVGTLALNYKLRIVANGTVSKLADVIDVYYVADATAAITRDALGTKIGTLTDVLGTTIYDENDVLVKQNISNVIKGSLLAGETATWSLVLKMQETAGNEYQNLTVGTDFSVELIATQMSYEKDSFDEKYDDVVVVPSPEIPAALVRPLDNLTIDTTGSKLGSDLGEFTLSAGYQFEPTESEDEAKLSEYKYWHADFAVSADRDVPKNSIVLAGYYDAWCSLNNDKWVAFTSSEAVEANTEIRLVQSLACVTYKDLCKYGNDGKGFQCGIGAVDAAGAAALAGTTITVELRMYETEGEWSDSSHTCTEVASGNYITIGTFTYTFPGVEVAGQAELEAAVVSGASSVVLGEGTYTVPAELSGDTLVIKGSGEGTVFDFTQPNNAKGASVTFENLHIQGKNENVMSGFGIQSTTGHIVYKNCTFDGAVTNEYYGSVEYIDCTFTGTGYITTYAVKSAVFTNCVFDKADSRAVLVYSHGDNPCEVTLTDCEFKAAAKAYTWNGDWTAAIEVDTTNISSLGTSVTIEDCTFDANYNGLFRDKSAAGKANAVITVDGVEQ